MDSMIKLPIIIVLLLIVASLFQGMYYLSKDDGQRDKNRLLKALTTRIVLSFLLFALLVVGYFTGVIQPASG